MKHFLPKRTSTFIDFSLADDPTILQELKAGNKKAYEEIIDRNSRFLKTEAIYWLKDIHLAEDAIQEVLSTLWKNRRKTDISVQLKTYLFNAIRKRCRQELRRRKRSRKIIQPINIDSIDEAYLGHCPAMPLEYKEIQQSIRNAIEHISSPAGRIVFKMRHIDDMRPGAIAKELNLTLSAVKKRASRAKQEFIEIYKKLQ